MLRRDDIISRLREKGYTKKDAEIIFKDVFDVIAEALVNRETITIYGFGTFSVRECKPHPVRKVTTGELGMTSAFLAPKFTAGALLRRAVKEGYIRK